MNETTGVTGTATDTATGTADSGPATGGGAETTGASDPLSSLTAYASDTATGDGATDPDAVLGALVPEQAVRYTVPPSDAPGFDPLGYVGATSDTTGQPDAVTAPGYVTGEVNAAALPDAVTAPGYVTGGVDATAQRDTDVGAEVGAILNGFETGGDGRGPGYLAGGGDPYAAA